MKISIISPCWGHEELGKQLFDGVRTTKGYEFELILVDNGNGVPDNLPKEKWLKVIKPGKNLGFGKGNNLGFKHSTGDIIVFINNDVIIQSPDWLQKLLKPLEQNRKILAGAQLVKTNDYTKVHGKNYNYINGWCMAMERELFEKTGGFDAGFGLGWFEDVYLSVKAEELGYELVEVKVPLSHMGSQTIADGRLNTNRLMVNAGSYFRQKIILDNIPKGKMRIVFICAGNYKFSDVTWEGRGTGGAEQSLILLTRELAKMGHQVDVYNYPEKLGKQNGVNYFHLNEFRYSDYADAVICFRNPVEGIEKLNTRAKIFWSCDQYTVGDFRENVMPFYDKIICISEFHKKYFKEIYGMKESQLMVIDLGVNLPDYEQEVEKIPGKLIFCTVPYRGLEKLLELFPRIRQHAPGVNLVVTSDYTLWGSTIPDNQMFQALAEGQKGITFLGKVDRKELIRHQLEAEIMAYPGNYDENFCISAAECMAAGAIPVYYDHGAMKTTVSTGGLLAAGDNEFVDKIVSLLEHEKLRKTVRAEGKRIAKKRFDWSVIAKQWESLIYSLIDMWNIDLTLRLPKGYEKMDVLDLGCGEYISGISENIPLLKFGSYHGVDIWDADLGKGSQKNFATKDVSWKKADILEFVKNEVKAKGKWDVVLLLDVMEHLPKDQAKEFLKNVEKLCKSRIIIFMPIGNHTLEANDGIVESSKNPYQKHLSEWTVDEWEELGYDVELFKGFHHSGELDAAWIMKDTNFMVECKTCGKTYNSSYYLAKHKIIHGAPESKTYEAEGVPLAHKKKDAPMPNVRLTFAKRVDLSVGNVNCFGKTETVVPYEQLNDVLRIVREGYGDDIVINQEFF